MAAQKTDVVTLQNGDRITDEIKRLERGRLEYSTDDMGMLNIEWDEIDVLTSVLTFEVELVVSDFFLGLTVFATADSRPPSEDATRRDFGSAITLGWSF